MNRPHMLPNACVLREMTARMRAGAAQGLIAYQLGQSGCPAKTGAVTHNRRGSCIFAGLE
jgi:hypothetical protein